MSRKQQLLKRHRRNKRIGLMIGLLVLLAVGVLVVWIHADAAEDAGADELQVAGVELEALMHLGGQFAGWGQDQDARLARAVTLGFVRVTVGEQPLQNREGEAAGFTGTCLRRDHQVATLQHGGNGPLLHRSRLGIARCLDGAD